DDLLRSKFKLKGIDSVKTDVSRQLAKKFAKKTKAKIDHLKPDLTITVNFKNNSIDLYSKSVILAGRYTKNSRNLPQKQKSCVDCKGKGCITCQYHGLSSFDSVEGKISEFLYKKFVSNQVRLTWIGGEDKTSLVKGKGRPFFVQVINPQKRKPRLPKIIKLDSVKVMNLKKISAIPKNPIKFRSKIEITVESKNDISSESLKKINDLNNSDIAIYEESKRIEKSIYGVKYTRITPNSFKIFIEMDGGVPIKKFVDGETIFPNLSDLLETKCICKEFDFTQIRIQ
ncbi:MAG: pseudouridine synthase, partial [Nitrosopumilaceae archaeon]|nr:pseudouridine synthase [Nitrosopumilaceae archaeon]